MTKASKDTISILQYNLNKNQRITESVLNHPDSQRYMILMLQEQYWSEYNQSSPMHHSWTLIEPTHKGDKPPRTAIYINNKILPATDYKSIHIPLSDVTAIKIRLKNLQKPMLLINIYNPTNDSLIKSLNEEIRKHIKTRDYAAILAGGDFNLHHPL